MQTVKPRISVLFFLEVPAVCKDAKRHEHYLDTGLTDRSSLDKIKASHGTNMGWGRGCPGRAGCHRFQLEPGMSSSGKQTH